MKKPKIMVLAHYWKATTGFGTQAHSLLTRLVRCPDVGAVAHLADGRDGGPFTEDGITVFPTNGRMTNDALAALVRKWGADVLIILFDAYYHRGIGTLLPGTAVLRWMPLDCDPMTPDVIPAMDGCYTALAMTKFALAQMQAAGVPAVLIPHGVEAEYAVLPDQEARRAFRAQLAGEDCEHLTAIVARNYPVIGSDPKWLQGQLRAWAAFAETRRGARLYLHTNMHGNAGEANLYVLCQVLGIQDKVCYPVNLNPTAGVSRAWMAKLYNSLDVLLAASATEGFGLPPVEAQACGVPVVQTRFAAMTEHTLWGHAVEPLDKQWCPVVRSWWAWPSVVGTTAALNELYAAWQDAGGAWPLDKRRAVAAAIHEEYSWDCVFEQQWAPLIRGLA